MSSSPQRRRARKFTDEETKRLVHEVKAREVAIYGTASQPPRLADMARAWEEITAAVISSTGIHRTVDQMKKRFSDLRRVGKRKVCCLHGEYFRCPNVSWCLIHVTKTNIHSTGRYKP